MGTVQLSQFKDILGRSRNILLASVFVFTQLLVPLSFMAHVAYADSEGPKYPSSAVSDDGNLGDKSWANPENIKQTLEQSDVVLAASETSEYLKATNFGFGVPENADISGITVYVTRTASQGGSIVDDVVRLLKDGNSTGNNKAQASTWSGGDSVVSYGSDSDTWGETWGYDDVNSPSFGVVFSVKNNQNNSRTATVKSITVEIEYSGSNQEEENGSPEHKVEICHATNSFVNPYRYIEVANPSTDMAGHSDHTGPVFDPDVHSQQDRGWGDIIPPVPGILDNGLNWYEDDNETSNERGREIWENECQVRDVGSLKVNKAIDTNGDDIFDAGNEEANALGFRWEIIDEDDGYEMGQKVSGVVAGQYQITEIGLDNEYEFIGWFDNSESGASCESPTVAELPIDVIVVKNELLEITLCNQKVVEESEPASLTIVKATNSYTPRNFNFDITDNEDFNKSFTLDVRLLSNNDKKTFNDLMPGRYKVTENLPTGWALDTIKCVDSASGEGVVFERAGNSLEIELSAEQDVTCTFNNIREPRTGSIRVVKKLYPSDAAGNFDLLVNETVVADGIGHGGSGVADDLPVGLHYQVSETMGEDTISEDYKTYYSCYISGIIPVKMGAGTTINNVPVVNNATTTCYFVNKKLPKVTIIKDAEPNADIDFPFTIEEYQRVNVQDKIFDFGLPGSFDATLFSSNHESFSQPFSLRDDGIDEEAASKDFYLKPGSYLVTEKIAEVANWSIDSIECENAGVESYGDNSVVVTVSYGVHVTCTFRNTMDEVVLNLEKENDADDVRSIGDIVTYTLTVSVPEDSGISYNTIVTDLPPENFKVNNVTTDSELVSSVHRPVGDDFTRVGTTYASPGEWNLGTLYPGDEVVLTYEATILDEVTPGTYPDIAYASGLNAEVGGAVVYSNVHEADDPFDGSEVTVAAERPEPRVLAKTGLPVTWQYIAVPILLIGLAISLVRRETKGAL